MHVSRECRQRSLTETGQTRICCSYMRSTLRNFLTMVQSTSFSVVAKFVPTSSSANDLLKMHWNIFSQRNPLVPLMFLLNKSFELRVWSFYVFQRVISRLLYRAESARARNGLPCLRVVVPGTSEPPIAFWWTRRYESSS